MPLPADPHKSCDAITPPPVICIHDQCDLEAEQMPSATHAKDPGTPQSTLDTVLLESSARYQALQNKRAELDAKRASIKSRLATLTATTQYYTPSSPVKLLDCSVDHALVHANDCPCIPSGIVPVTPFSHFYATDQHQPDHRADVVGEPPPPQSTLCTTPTPGHATLSVEHDPATYYLFTSCIGLFGGENCTITTTNPSSLLRLACRAVALLKLSTSSSLLCNPIICCDPVLMCHVECAKPLARPLTIYKSKSETSHSIIPSKTWTSHEMIGMLTHAPLELWKSHKKLIVLTYVILGIKTTNRFLDPHKCTEDGEITLKCLWNITKLIVMIFAVIFLQGVGKTISSASSCNFSACNGMKYGETTQTLFFTSTTCSLDDTVAFIHGENEPKSFAAATDTMFFASNLLEIVAMAMNAVTATDSLSSTEIKNECIRDVYGPSTLDFASDEVAKIDFQVLQHSTSSPSVPKIISFVKLKIETPLHYKNTSCYNRWHETFSLWGAYVVTRQRPPAEPPPTYESRPFCRAAKDPFLLANLITMLAPLHVYIFCIFTFSDVLFERGVTRFKTEWMLLAS